MVDRERAGGEPDSGFLPPQPTGPEPDLAGTAPAPPAEPVFLPPEGAAAPGAAQPAPQADAPPSQPPPGAAEAWQQQPGQWGGPPVTRVPDNGDALAGLILSASAATLLLLSVGASSIISVICAGFGIYYSRKGRARVDRGETPKHRGVAQAGFVTGIVALVLSILMTIAWVAAAILYATNEEFRQDLEDELDGDESSPDGFETAIPLAVAAVRALALLLR